jgi:hypothetical protein
VIEVREHLGGSVRIECSEQQDTLGLLELEKQVCRVGRGHVGQQFAQGSPLAVGNQVPDIGLDFRMKHGGVGLK